MQKRKGREPAERNITQGNDQKETQAKENKHSEREANTHREITQTTNRHKEIERIKDQTTTR